MKFYALPLVIGLVTLFITASPAYLLGYGGGFVAPGGDLAQHLTGVWAYLYGDWGWPLFATDRINHPEGTNIIFTDSVPLAGLLAKLLHAATGLRFNYLGLWFAVVWLGQALAAAYLLRQLGVQRRLLIAAGCVLALMVPAFLYRHGHLALSSHFLLLFSLGLYVRGLRSLAGWQWWAAWAALLSVAVWTHAYLFLMAYALFGAAVIDAGLRHRMLGGAIWRAAATSVPAVVLAVTGGYLERGVVAAEGYHFFSMNLLSPVWPQASWWLGGKLLDPTGGQYEGFNYLGLGALAIIAWAGWLARRRLPQLVAASPTLVAVLVLMFLYSLSHHVWAGPIELFRLPVALDFFPFATFRAAGRFFWPLTYVLVLGSFALVALELARRRGRRGVLLLLALVAVQVVDASVVYRSMRKHIRHESPLPPELATLSELIAGHERITVVPARNCWSRESEDDIIQLTLLAARAGTPINVVHAARAVQAESCVEEKALGALPDLAGDELLIALLREGMVTTLAEERYADCRFLEHGFLVCSGSGRWPASTPLPLEPVVVPSCPVSFDLTDAPAPLARWFDGFGNREAWGRWTTRAEARIMCRLSGAGTLRLTALGYHAPGSAQRVSFAVEGGAVVSGEFPRDEVRAITIPVTGHDVLRLDLRVAEPVSPEALRESSDGRELGLKLLKMEFVPSMDVSE